MEGAPTELRLARARRQAIERDDVSYSKFTAGMRNAFCFQQKVLMVFVCECVFTVQGKDVCLL